MTELSDEQLDQVVGGAEFLIPVALSYLLPYLISVLIDYFKKR